MVVIVMQCTLANKVPKLYSVRVFNFLVSMDVCTVISSERLSFSLGQTVALACTAAPAGCAW